MGTAQQLSHKLAQLWLTCGQVLHKVKHTQEEGCGDGGREQQFHILSPTQMATKAHPSQDQRLTHIHKSGPAPDFDWLIRYATHYVYQVQFDQHKPQMCFFFYHPKTQKPTQAQARQAVAFFPPSAQGA